MNAASEVEPLPLADLPHEFNAAIIQCRYFIPNLSTQTFSPTERINSRALLLCTVPGRRR